MAFRCCLSQPCSFSSPEISFTNKSQSSCDDITSCLVSLTAKVFYIIYSSFLTKVFLKGKKKLLYGPLHTSVLNLPKDQWFVFFFSIKVLSFKNLNEPFILSAEN